jgi:hypothetical protein
VRGRGEDKGREESLSPFFASRVDEGEEASKEKIKEWKCSFLVWQDD